MNLSPKRTELELAYWPVVVITVRDGTPVEEFKAVFEKYEREVFPRGERYVSITNLTVLGRVPGATERRVMADWMRENDDVMSKLAIGNSTVIRSGLVRGAMTALYWVFKPSIPQTSHATLAEAVVWANEALRGEGLTPPLGLREWAQQHAA